MAQSFQWQTHGIARWRRHALPLLVWLAAVGASGWFFAHRSARFEAMGIANGDQRSIAALGTGRVRLLPVRLFEEVTQGQVLVVLEDDRIQAELATAAAEAARLKAELTATEAQLTAETTIQEAEQLGEARRFAVDLERKRIQELELTTALKKNQVALEYLRLRKDALRDLCKLHASTEFDWRAAETDYAQMVIQIEEDHKTLTQVQADLRDTRERQNTYEQRYPVFSVLDQVLAPLRAAVTVQERRIAELSLDRSMLALRSPMDGVVSELVRRAGETVMTGEPILTVSASQPSEVLIYVSAGQVNQFRVGMPVELEMVGRDHPRMMARSQVLGVGPAAVQLPMRLWQSPTVPEWGWPIGIAVSHKLQLLPGELVGVRKP